MVLRLYERLHVTCKRFVLPFRLYVLATMTVTVTDCDCDCDRDRDYMTMTMTLTSFYEGLYKLFYGYAIFF